MPWKHWRILIAILALLFTDHSASFKYASKLKLDKNPLDSIAPDKLATYKSVLEKMKLDKDNFIQPKLWKDKINEDGLEKLQTFDKLTLDKQTSLEPRVKKNTLDKCNGVLNKTAIDKATLVKLSYNNLTLEQVALDKPIMMKAAILTTTLEPIFNKSFARTMNKRALSEASGVELTWNKATGRQPDKPEEKPNGLNETVDSNSSITDYIKPIKNKPIPQPIFESIAISCYSCSSDYRGSCAQSALKSEFYTTCVLTSKESGCYAAIDRSTKIITRGCLSVISKPMERYCGKEKQLCNICYSRSCNKEKLPEILDDSDAGISQILNFSFALWTICIVSSLRLA